MSESIIKIGERGQITIPLDARTEANIQPGDYVRVTTHNNEIVIEPIEISKKKKKSMNGS